MKNIIGSIVLCLVASTSFAISPLQQKNPETTSSKQVTTPEDKKLANKEPHKTEKQSENKKEDQHNEKNDHKMHNSKDLKTAPKTSIEEIENKHNMNPLIK